MVAWSLGGPRAGGYAARNPGNVHRLVLLAPPTSSGPIETIEAGVAAIAHL